MSTNTELYEQDFYLWCLETWPPLGAREFDAIDVPHLIEEIRDLGNNVRSALESDLGGVVLHLLKWQYQPGGRQDSHSWEDSIMEHRRRMHRLLKKSPSLKAHLDEAVSEEYPVHASELPYKTGLPRATFPETCPWTLEQLLNDAFFPAP